MKEIIWEEYLSDDVREATEEQIKFIEDEIQYKLPEKLKEILMNHGGQSPENLRPFTASGIKRSLDCFYHAHEDDEEDISYTILWSRSCLVDEGYSDYLIPFSKVSNVFFCLNYKENLSEPKVVFLNRDNGPEDDGYLLADSFDEFLEKYTVEEE